MYHWEIALGLMVGVVSVSATVFSVAGTGTVAGAGNEGFIWIRELLTFMGRVVGTCAVLYVLFLCRLLGAGDIKLMAVCVGVLGICRGVWMIFCGFVLALIVESVCVKVWDCGYRCLFGVKVRMAPYLFGGYCLMMLFGNE